MDLTSARWLSEGSCNYARASATLGLLRGYQEMAERLLCSIAVQDHCEIPYSNLHKKLFQFTILRLKFEYRTRAIISRGLYTFLPHFQRPFMYCDHWPYVWLVSKSGLWWRAYGKLFTVMGGDFKFRIVIRNIFFLYLEIWKMNLTFWKCHL